MTAFQEAVLKVVRMVPAGKVASYGQVAAYVGMPRAARQVGWAMRSMEGVPDFPWWRVVNNAGKITIKGNQFNTAMLQADLLRFEGIQVTEAFELPIEACRYRPAADELAPLGLDPEYVQAVLDRYI